MKGLGEHDQRTVETQNSNGGCSTRQRSRGVAAVVAVVVVVVVAVGGGCRSSGCSSNSRSR